MRIGRPLEFDPDETLEAAMQAFWSKGYENTSLQDLLAAMHLSKSSLYQAFGGKQDLFRKCLTHYTQQMTSGLRALLDRTPSGQAFIEAFLRSAVEDARSRQGARGCLIMNTASELAQREPAIAGDVADGIESFRSVVLEAVKRAQREGDVSNATNAQQLASFLISSASGLKTQAKAGATVATLEAIIRITLKALA